MEFLEEPGAAPALNPKKREKDEEKMEGIDPNTLLAMMNKGDNNGDDKTLWLFLLLLMFGKDGLGGKNGCGDTCCPPVTLEQMNDMQNALGAQLTNNNNNSNDHFLQANDTAARNQLANSLASSETRAAIADSASQNLIGQKDISAAIAQCCCDNLLSQKDTQRIISDTACQTQRAIDQCCCETQNSIAMQTQVLSRQICEDGDKTRALITQNKIDELQAALTDSKLANSNLSQTTLLQQSIRDACCQPCQPCHPHPWPNGGGGGAVPA